MDDGPLWSFCQRQKSSACGHKKVTKADVCRYRTQDTSLLGEILQFWSSEIFIFITNYILRYFK